MTHRPEPRTAFMQSWYPYGVVEENYDERHRNAGIVLYCSKKRISAMNLGVNGYPYKSVKSYRSFCLHLSLLRLINK